MLTGRTQLRSATCSNYCKEQINSGQFDDMDSDARVSRREELASEQEASQDECQPLHRSLSMQVTLLSSDGESFDVSVNVANWSVTIQNTIEGAKLGDCPCRRPGLVRDRAVMRCHWIACK